MLEIMAKHSARQSIRHPRPRRRWSVVVAAVVVAFLLGAVSPAFASARAAAGHVIAAEAARTTSALRNIGRSAPKAKTVPTTAAVTRVPAPVTSAASTAAVDVAGEAAIAATSASHPSGTLNVVGLGDSVEAGSRCGCTTFVTQVGTRIAAAQGRALTVENEAFGGATSDDVLTQLRSSDVQADVSSSDLVVIEIGANDFDESLASSASCEPVTNTSCYASTAATMTANLTKIVDEVKALQTKTGAQIVVMGYWNVFKDGDVAAKLGSTYVTVSGQLTKWVNSLDRDIAARAGVTYADAYTPFDGSDGSRNPTDDLAYDGDHPNAAGHALLAEAVVQSLGSSTSSV